MEMAQLRALVAASRERNVGRAADSLALTPSPVSRSVRDLEREVGGPLFLRKYHDLQLTDMGKELLPKAVAILIAVEHFPTTRPRRPLRVGVTAWVPSRYRHHVEDALEAFGESVTTIDQEMSFALLHRLSHGDLDLAVVNLPVDQPGLESRALGACALYAYSAEPIATDGPIEVADLAGRDVVIVPSPHQHRMIEVLVDNLRTAGVGEISTIDFTELVLIESRLLRTGEVLVTTNVPDGPVSGLLRRTALSSVEIADLPHFEIGVAWRSNDWVIGPRIVPIIDRLRSAEADLEQL